MHFFLIITVYVSNFISYKIDFYLVLEGKSSPYNIFTIIWNPSPALISKCLKRVRFLLLKMFITSNLTPRGFNTLYVIVYVSWTLTNLQLKYHKF